MSHPVPLQYPHHSPRKRNQMNRTLAQRAAAAAGALVLAVAGVLVATAPASAALPANIDDARDGSSSITVHKHLQPSPAGEAGDGSEIPGGLPDPLEGVDFALYQLSGIDLSTEAGWDEAAAISAAIDGGAQPVPNADPATTVTIGGTPYPVAPVGTQATGSDGATTFGELSFGVYLVVEGEDNGDNSITTKAAPFVVSLPFATGANTWLYDVHAYPKNSVTGIVKTVTPPAEGSAEDLNRDLVRWNIALSVPVLAPGGTLTTLNVVDTIDAAELSFVATPPAGVAGNSFTVTDAAGDELAVPDDMFTWSPEPPAGTTLTLTATPAGLTWLTANAQGGTVSASILTRLVAPIPADGEVTNNVVGNVNDGTVTTETPAPVGELEVFKYAETAPGEQTGLAGASFALHTGTPATSANRVVLNGVDEWGPTDVSGYVKISGLTPGTYYLVETVPPTGYVLDATPRAVTIVAGQTVRPDAGAGSNYTEVENQQVPPWLLPLTGADGTLWFTIGGIALLTVAAGAAVLVARRKRAQV